GLAGACGAPGVGAPGVGAPPGAPQRQERKQEKGPPAVAKHPPPGANPPPPRHERSEHEAGDRLVPDLTLGENPDRVGAGAEERGVAKGHDAGVAEDEVERYGEQDRDQDFRPEPEVLWKDEVESDRKRPREKLP